MDCSTCRTRAHCLPCGLTDFATTQFDRIEVARRKLAARTALYEPGDPFTHVYALRSGTLKSSVFLGDGREQVSGFHVAGEVVGLDAIADGCHASTAQALEDSEVCAIPYLGIADLAASTRGIQDMISRSIGREILRDHRLLLLLGSMSAEERIAAFLLDLSLRYGIRGYSPFAFHLRMSRAEIGSYLGLQVETVCRAFAALQRAGLIRTERRMVHIVDLDGLRRRTDSSLRAPAAPEGRRAVPPRPQIFPLDVVSR